MDFSMTDINPMLARPFEGDVDTYALNSEWVFEQKIDGKRALVHVNDREAVAYNRQGEETGMPDTVYKAFDHKGFDSQWVFDGEILDHILWVFDVLICPGADGGVTDLRDLAFSARRQFLEGLFDTWDPEHVNLVRQEHVDVKKSMLLKQVHENGGEGVVIKHLASKYEGKRSHNWLKLKFTKTHEVVVTNLNRGDKDLAVDIGYTHEGELVEAGGLKVPERFIELVEVGTVVEVRYLYATNDHKLYQPVFLRLRDDKKPEECTTEGLQYTDRKVLV
jgi:bifunctional non-homologous end joining protein LigD